MPVSKTKDSFLAEARAKKHKDPNPKWEGSESWPTDQFLRHFNDAMTYYRLESSGRDLKPEVIKWMNSNGYESEQIKIYKDSKDYRSTLTMGAIAACLNRGMVVVREDFNNGKNTADWLHNEIKKAIEAGKLDKKTEAVAIREPAQIVTIQDRLKETASSMTEEIETAVDNFIIDPDNFNPKTFKVLNLLKGKQAKAAHARIIQSFYKPAHEEITEFLKGNDPQLKEAYSHLSKSNAKKLQEFYLEVINACDMLMKEQQVNRKPRVKKSKPAEKLVEKLKYAKMYEPLKLVSINPADIVGAKELWVFNTKTRKLGKYVADEFAELSIKGTSVVGFNENQSIQKTLRKPEEQLKEFKTAGKVALRKFIEDIKAVDIKLNGRINEDTILLRVQ